MGAKLEALMKNTYDLESAQDPEESNHHNIYFSIKSLVPIYLIPWKNYEN